MAVALPRAVNAASLEALAALQSEGEITMNRSSTRAFRWLAPLLGITLMSGVASAKVITEVWQVKGVHTPADEAKIHTALTQLPSVTDAVVHMTTVRVTFDDQKLQDSAIKDSVAKAGSFELMNRVPEHPKTAAETSKSSNTKSTTNPKS
jgi:copper chaperone CopZ